jgi:hypothetical protein
MIKLQRAGFTETNLLFIYWLESNCDLPINQLLYDVQKLDIQRLYSKSGFYDKQINGNYFNIDFEKAKTSDLYHKFINDYTKSLYDCDYLILMSHIYKNKEYFQFKDQLNNYYNKYFNHKNYLNKQLFRYWTDNYSASIYKYLDNKKVLIVNSFGSLIYQQYISGNVHKIFPDFPILNNIDYVDFPYTFFNSGPHENFFETLNFYYDLIKQKNFDIALVSCGPYGCILVDLIVKNLNKSAITMGSGITPMFGINPGKDEPFWISEIPKKYIPLEYEKIENGRYWRGKNNK